MQPLKINVIGKGCEARIRHEPRKLRYPLLFRTHVLRFQRILRVSQQQFHNPDTALPYSGSPRVGFAGLISTMPVLRHPSAIPPHFVAFVWWYHRPLSLFVSPHPLPRGGIRSGLDVPGSSPVVTPYQFSLYSWWSITGLPGSWGVLSCLCPALRPRPRPSCYAIAAGRSRPRYTDDEGHSIQQNFEAQSRGFSTRCLRFQIRFPYTGKTRFRWVANPYRVGFEPTGLQWRISSRLPQPIYSNAPGFAWRHHIPTSAFVK